jgi:hypothetical protein
MIVEEVKNMKAFYEKIDMALQQLVDRYKDYFDTHKKDRVFALNNLSRDLERISNLLNNYGYTYSPTDMQDVSEEVFEVLVGRYMDGFQKFIDSGDGNLETLNVDIKNMLSIVDRHKNVSEHFI